MSQRDTVIHLVAGGYVSAGLCVAVVVVTVLLILVCGVNLDPPGGKLCLLCNSEIRTFGRAVFDVQQARSVRFVFFRA